jgi:hypothetical protein
MLIAALGDQIDPSELFVELPNVPPKYPYQVKCQACEQFAFPFAPIPVE